MNKRRQTIFIIALALLTTLVVGAVAYALYAGSDGSQHVISSPSFNFTADFLETSQTTNFAYSDFSISIYNYDKDNSAQGSSAVITYSTEVKYYNSANSQVGTTLTSTGNTLASGNRSANLDVDFEAQASASYVIVTVKATAPYTKELSGRFNLYSAPTNNYSFVDNGSYCTLTILTGDSTASLTLSWNTDYYAPDDTNSLISGYTPSGTAQSKTLTLAANTSYTLVFFENQAVTHADVSNASLGSTLTLPTN